MGVHMKFLINGKIDHKLHFFVIISNAMQMKPIFVANVSFYEILRKSFECFFRKTGA